MLTIMIWPTTHKLITIRSRVQHIALLTILNMITILAIRFIGQLDRGLTILVPGVKIEG